MTKITDSQSPAEACFGSIASETVRAGEQRMSAFPQKRTKVDGATRSALCHKRTHAPQQNSPSFDHFVSDRGHAWRNRKPSVLAVLLRVIAHRPFTERQPLGVRRFFPRWSRTLFRRQQRALLSGPLRRVAMIAGLQRSQIIYRGVYYLEDHALAMGNGCGAKSSLAPKRLD